MSPRSLDSGRAPATEKKPPKSKEALEEQIDLGSDLSFPASDPPAYMGSFATTGAPPKHKSTENTAKAAPKKESGKAGRN